VILEPHTDKEAAFLLDCPTNATSLLAKAQEKTSVLRIADVYAVDRHAGFL
jgi:hypothetical protein